MLCDLKTYVAAFKNSLMFDGEFIRYQVYSNILESARLK